MTIANNERREIAARLREDIGLHAFAEIFGFSWTDDERDWYWRDVTAKVADYIEPEPERTCYSDNEPEFLYGDKWHVFRCSECGNKVNLCCNRKPNYCPNCGAKVIKE